TAIFDHFVRNRHFSSKPFTDRRPIFIDVSVNGSNFVKCSTRSIGTSRRDYGQSAVLELFVRKNKQKLAAIAHPGPRGGKSRQKPSKMPESCLLPPKNGPRIPESRPKIVYQGGQIKCPQLQPSQPNCTPQMPHRSFNTCRPDTLSRNMHKKAAAPTLRLLKIIYFSTQPPSIGTFAP
ncbi:hypothetical protein ABHA69_05925, partial [Ligilactobacillus ruminis]